MVASNLPDGPFILSPVHRSFIDTPIVGVITGKRLRFMGKESLWKSKPLGAFLTFFGGFPVERGAADRTCPAGRRRRARPRRALGHVPGGHPSGGAPAQPRAGARRSRVRCGESLCAHRAGRYRWRSAKALPLGARIPRPHRIVAVIGEPIMPPERSTEGTATTRSRISPNRSSTSSVASTSKLGYWPATSRARPDPSVEAGASEARPPRSHGR